MILGKRTVLDALISRTIILIEQIDNVIQLDDRRLLETQLNRMKRFLLENQLNRMKRLLLDSNNQFQHQQMAPLETVNNCLERMEDKVRWARLLICRSQWPQRCFYGLFSRPKVSGQILDWMTNVNKLFKKLQIGLVALRAMSSAVQLPKPLIPRTWAVSPAVERGIKHGEVVVERGMKHGEVVVERWLREAPHVRIIGVCGCAGVGKTRLLQNVYNTYKVSDVFDVVIWVTVGISGMTEVQDCIARAINLDLRVHHSDNETRKHIIKLFEYLQTKKFLLIFDDLWSPLDLDELGVKFGDDKGSKIICSSRMRHVIHLMGADNSIYIPPLTRDESWELFRNVAFKDDHLQQDLEHIARKVADECKGLPLAVNVIAATMRGNTSVNQWNLALTQMQTPIDHIFPASYHSIDAHLYQILRWSYERLPDANFKTCFLYCAMFPRDEEIEVNKLVGMWIAEGLVQSMGTAHSYIKLLVDRCFFQVIHIPHGIVFLKADNILRDLAIYIGWREEHCLLVAGQRFQNFPIELVGNNWKRVSYYGNNIEYLPAKILKSKCRKLVSLTLGGNKELEEVPKSFLANLLSIRVLDLSRTKIKLLPTTLWQLTQLVYLDVSYTQIEELSEDIGYLSNLQFLNLSGCSNLKSLPQAIGHLSKLQFLNMVGCYRITAVPSVIYELKNLEYFQYNIFKL